MSSFVALLEDFISGNPALALVMAFIGGLASTFSPCTLTSIPLVIAYVGGYARDNRRRAFIYSLVFCVGLAVTFTTLGALAAILGRLMGGIGKRWYLVLGAFTILLGLWVMGVIGISLPSFSPKGSLRRTGLLGAFSVGVLAGVISSPCSTPVLAAILALVAGKGNLVFGVSLLGAYAVGHSALALIAGTSVAFVDRLAKCETTERLGQTVRLALGILVVIAGIYLFYMGV